MIFSPVVTERKKPGPKPKKVFTHMSEVASWPSGQLLEDFLLTPPIVQRLRYREQLTLPQALEELAKLRAISQIASEEINQRAQPIEDSCMMCGKIMPPGGKAIQMVVVRDEKTGTAQTKVLCSIECVRQHNKQRMNLMADEHRGIAGEIK